MKKIISLLLVVLIVFSLMGCKSKGNINADEEISFTAGEESQADIQENIGANEQEQKETVKESVNTPDDTADTTTEITDISDNAADTSPEITDTSDDVSVVEPNTDLQNKKEDVNQVALDSPNMCNGMVVCPAFSFDSISDMVNTIKTHEYSISDEERKSMEECLSTLTDKQLSADGIAKIGTKDDVRFEDFNIDSIKYFYKIKDIPGYTVTNVTLGDKQIQFTYVPIGKEKITEEDRIHVTYMRNEHFVTDSYFDDYMEYKKVKTWNLNSNDSVSYGDDYLYIKWYDSYYASIMFAVENTIIRIYSNSDMANYEALKKLCVAEKVIVK